MKAIISLFFGIMIFWNDCSAQKLLQEKPEPRQLSFTEIKSIEVANGLLTVKITAQTPNPCYAVSEFKLDKDGHDFIFEIYGELVTMNPCAMVISSVEAEKTILLTEPGEYKLSFRNVRGAPIDTTIVMKDW